MTQKMLDALFAAGNKRWPYVSVGTVLDHKTVRS